MKLVYSLQDQTFAFSHFPGAIPESIESWKIFVSTGEISPTFSLKNHGGISSGSHALFGFRDFNCLITPFTVIFIELMLGVGVFPTSGILSRFSSVNTLENCSFKISDLGWDSLESRRKKARLNLMYKLIHKLINIDTANHLESHSEMRTRGSHSFKYRIPKFYKDVFKFSFFLRTIWTLFQIT